VSELLFPESDLKEGLLADSDLLEDLNAGLPVFELLSDPESVRLNGRLAGLPAPNDGL